MRKEKSSKGITLIALVITIIVLLILAGVSISMISGDEGIVKKASEAKEKTNLAKEEEEKNIQDVTEYIDSQISGDTVDNLPVGIEVTGTNRTLTGGTPTYKNPIIPVGFKAVNDGASWEISGNVILGWNDGLVIEDENENQFVWVPVDGTNVPYEKWCNNSNGYGITYEDVEDDEIVSGVIENAQITKYGGFWIGRYEAGRSDVDSSTEATNNVSTGVDLLIQRGAQPWNSISYTNAKIVAESYVNNNNVKSGLVTGTQWDTVMKWIENAGYDVTNNSTDFGNYFNNTNIKGNGRYSNSYDATSMLWQIGNFLKEENSELIIGTGLDEISNTKNIYDLAGNLYEWNTESCFNYYIFRGGNWLSEGNTATASSRTNPYMSRSFFWCWF